MNRSQRAPLGHRRGGGTPTALPLFCFQLALKKNAARRPRARHQAGDPDREVENSRAGDRPAGWRHPTTISIPPRRTFLNRDEPLGICTYFRPA
jgi:hypothetical protein